MSDQDFALVVCKFFLRYPLTRNGILLSFYQVDQVEPACLMDTESDTQSFIRLKSQTLRILHIGPNVDFVPEMNNVNEMSYPRKTCHPW